MLCHRLGGTNKDKVAIEEQEVLNLIHLNAKFEFDLKLSGPYHRKNKFGNSSPSSLLFNMNPMNMVL